MRVIPKNADQPVEAYFPKKQHLSMRCCCLSTMITASALFSPLAYPIDTGNGQANLLSYMSLMLAQALVVTKLQTLIHNHYDRPRNLYNTLSGINDNTTEQEIDILLSYINKTNEERQLRWLTQAALANALLNCPKSVPNFDMDSGSDTSDETNYTHDEDKLTKLYELISKIKLGESFLKNWKIEGDDTPLCIKLNYELYRLKQAIEQMRQDETYDASSINANKNYLSHNTRLLHDMSLDNVKVRIQHKNHILKQLGPDIFKHISGRPDLPGYKPIQGFIKPPGLDERIAWEHARKQLNEHLDKIHHNYPNRSARAPHLPYPDRFFDVETQTQRVDNPPNNSMIDYLTSCFSAMFSRCCSRRQVNGLSSEAQRPLLAGGNAWTELTTISNTNTQPTRQLAQPSEPQNYPGYVSTEEQKQRLRRPLPRIEPAFPSTHNAPNNN